jgi:hypothetical protein
VQIAPLNAKNIQAEWRQKKGVVSWRLGKACSAFRVSRFFVFFRELSEGFCHVQKAGLIQRILNALGKPDAFRGIATVID